jgi:hypothetical protein
MKPSKNFASFENSNPSNLETPKKFLLPGIPIKGPLLVKEFTKSLKGPIIRVHAQLDEGREEGIGSVATSGMLKEDHFPA